jgi:hypothetical protein
MEKHKQTVYLVQDETGKLTVLQYAPTMSYAGQKDSDQYACMQGLFIDELSHDLWLGDVKCHRNQGASWGINTVKDLTCKIVAKKTFVWDMSKPIGQRETETKQTTKFLPLLKQIHATK